MTTLKLLVLANRIDWQSLQQKMDAVRAFYAPVCNLEITIKPVSMEPTYALYPDLAPLYIIDRGYYDVNIATPNVLAADIIMFVTEPPLMTVTPLAYMSENNIGPWETTIFAHGENDHTYIDGADLGDSFVLYACHELSHVFYRMVGKPDMTHTYFPAPDTQYIGPPSKALSDFNLGSRFAILNWLLAQLKAMATALAILKTKQNVSTVLCAAPVDPANSANPQTQTPAPAPSTNPSAKPNPDTLQSPWSDPVIAHHNVRALCDLEGLSYEQKETLTACVYVESQFHIEATHQNTIIEPDGARRIASTDFGICQWNDVYHGNEITPDEALHDPEKAVRLMCAYWRAGKMNQWVSYSSGAYKRWVGKV